ncbi:MAG: hypothetical protein JSS10_03505 [Verrucomicrobia bacterium]|nr:hypothetical protein [Verrucomicrobiota bacterium]
MIVVLLASLGYALPNYVDFRCAKSIQILALNILTAAGFGIMRDLRFNYQCIEYHTIGHSRSHKQPLKTNNPLANGLVTGVDFGLNGMVMGVGLALAARVTKYNPITAHQIAPYAAALAILSYIITGIVIKRTENFLASMPAPHERTDLFKGVIYPFSRTFHPVDLRKIPADKRYIWLACQLSNYVGNYFFLRGSLLLMIGVVAVRFFQSYYRKL